MGSLSGGFVVVDRDDWAFNGLVEYVSDVDATRLGRRTQTILAWEEPIFLYIYPNAGTPHHFSSSGRSRDTPPFRHLDTDQ